MGCTLVLYGWYPFRKGNGVSRKFLRGELSLQTVPLKNIHVLL